jgi:hypothetical protein
MWDTALNAKTTDEIDDAIDILNQSLRNRTIESRSFSEQFSYLWDLKLQLSANTHANTTTRRLRSPVSSLHSWRD